MTKRLTLAAFALVAFASLAFSQGSGFWPNWPLVGSASYCVTTVNGTCTATVPAGPTVVTGNENVPANTGSSGASAPTNILVPLASLNALPITVVVVTTPPSGISAANISGGVLYTSATTITSANITLPVSPIDGQQYRVSSNQTITTLSVTAGGSTNTMGTNTQPTVLTASTTVPQGYTFRFNLADTKWYRMQ